jgi:hypothetical protein
LIGRYWYRIDAGQSGRWMMIRERADDEEDEVVTRGSMRNPTLALIIDDIVEELLALSEEVQSND